MEPEEYYDSLDEDSNYESIDNGCFESNTNIPNIEADDDVPIKCYESKEVQVKPQLDLSQTEGLFLPLDLDLQEDVIPFYEKNLSKSEVGNNTKFTGENEKNKTTKRRPGKKKSLIPIGRLKSKSYLDMFHAKMGMETSDNNSTNDTSRATAPDLTPKSYVTGEDSERNTPLSKTREYSETDSFYEGSVNKHDYSLSLASLDSKFCSVSQQNVGVLRMSKSKRKYSKPLISNIPELGGLGPEIPKDKLDTLKRRQLYGQKVSENNKIKMQERRLLQSLQQEIKRCNNIQTK